MTFDLQKVSLKPSPQKGLAGHFLAVRYVASQSPDRGHRPPLPLSRHDPQAQGDADQRDEHEHGAQGDLHPTTFRRELGHQAGHAISMGRVRAVGKSGGLICRQAPYDIELRIGALGRKHG